jgi:predicted metal-dependent peptidase
MIMASSISKFDLAKGRIALHCGFMLPLLSKLKWIDTDRVPVAGTNGREAYYNGAHFDSERTLGETIFIVLHEVGHCMFSHMSRLGGRDKNIANIAMDFALNKRLHDMIAQMPALKAETPKDALLDPVRWGDRNWESIYDELRKEQPQVNEPGQGGGSGPGGKSPPQPGQSNGKKKYQMFDEVMAAGSKLGPDGEIEDGSAASETEANTLDKSWLQAAQMAATMAKARGIQAGMLEEFIGEMLKPNIDWKTQLQDLISRIGRDESSWRRFNKRHVHREAYLPGMYSEHCGPIAFMLDTSGSMSSDEGKAALGAMNDILEDVKPERIHFGQCDTRMQGDVEELTPQDLPLCGIEMKGRGGTDLNPIFAWAVEHQSEIDCLIVQTDGHISPIADHNIPYGLPMIWVVTTDNVTHCTFGNVVQVKL